MFWFQRTPRRAWVGRLASIIATVGLFPNTATALAEPSLSAPRIEHGRWQGGAVVAEGGEFTACTVGSRFAGDVMFAVYVQQDGHIVLVLSNDRWALGRYEPYPVRLEIDQRAERSPTAYGMGHRLLISLGSDDHFFDALRRGRALRMITNRQTFSFPLTGTYVALQRLNDCVWQNTVTAQNSNPFGDLDSLDDPFKSGTFGRANTANRGTPLTESQLRRLLVRSGVESPIILPAETNDDDIVSQTTQFWIATLDPLVVGVSLYFPVQVPAHRGMQTVAGGIGDACDGQTAIAVDNTVRGSDFTIGRAAVDCRESDGQYEFYVTGVFGGNETLFLLHVSTEPGDRTADRINDNIQSVVYQLQ